MDTRTVTAREDYAIDAKVDMMRHHIETNLKKTVKDIKIETDMIGYGKNAGVGYKATIYFE